MRLYRGLRSMLITHDFEQGSPEWHESRLGYITASNFKKVLSKGQGKTRKAYMYEIAAEIMTGEMQDSYSNQSMDWGKETEDQARSMYELDRAVSVDPVGFVCFEEKMIGCSPDGLVGEDGLIEIKCPKTTTQIETFLSGKMPSIHKPQVQGQLWVTGRDWCDFVSFDPRINGESSYFAERVYRDEKYIHELSKECDSFLAELKEMIEMIGGKYET